MRTDHIAMYVNDLEAAKQFFIKYFGGVANEKYHNQKTRLETYFLTFEDHAHLEIMTRPSLSEGDQSLGRYGYIHLAFSVGSAKKEDELTKILATDGYEVLSGPRTTGDGYYERGGKEIRLRL